MYSSNSQKNLIDTISHAHFCPYYGVVACALPSASEYPNHVMSGAAECPNCVISRAAEYPQPDFEFVFHALRKWKIFEPWSPAYIGEK
jgi:hypothetical protein